MIKRHAPPRERSTFAGRVLLEMWRGEFAYLLRAGFVLLLLAFTTKKNPD
jgi:hypothetical protein